jgi:hypothetical protein
MLTAGTLSHPLGKDPEAKLVEKKGVNVSALFDSGRGFLFAPSVRQYSACVAASPGFVLRRIALSTPTPTRKAFERCREFLPHSVGLRSICAVELRSPTPASEQGFDQANAAYTALLGEMDLLHPMGNPIARTNVCPVDIPPATPVVTAFSIAVPRQCKDPSFVISGSAEAPEGKGSYASHMVAPDEHSDDAMVRKADWVLSEMSRRMQLIGVDWSDCTTVRVYTDYGSSRLLEHVQTMAAASCGVTWHHSTPPVRGLAYEMDCRRTDEIREPGSATP